MQPPRDDTDPRFIPARLGGLGGFSYYTKQGAGAPYRWLSVIPKRERDTLSIDAVLAKAYSPDAIRGRARALLALAMERVESTLSDDANELRLNELSPVIASLGRISGVQDDEGKDTSVTIRIVRDTPVYNEGGAHVDNLPKDMGDQHLALPPSPDTSPEAYAAIVAHAEREVRSANAMQSNDFGIATSRDA